MLVPALLSLAFYEWLTSRMYGVGHLLIAARYCSSRMPAGGRGSILEQQIIGLEYLGGCFLPILCYLPLLWQRRSLVKGACLIAPCLLLPLVFGCYKTVLWTEQGQLDWTIFLQSCIFLAGGFHILALAVNDFTSRRDATALLLLLWILGLLVFSTALNWTINGRSLLLVAPAVGILVARRLERQATIGVGIRIQRLIPGAVVISILVSLFLAMEDYDLANSGRAAARQLAAEYKGRGGTLWFQGHWGFQHYMEHSGAVALDRNSSMPELNDIVVVPSNASNLFDFSVDLVRLVDVLEFTPNKHCSTMNWREGAGFYAAMSKSFPFLLRSVPPERYYVFEVKQTLESAKRAPGGLSEQGALAYQFAINRNAKAGIRP